MKKTFLNAVSVALLAATLSSCFTINHTVGTGAAGNTSVEERQWFILFGLVPLNDVDTKQMAGDAQNYTIKTERNVVDVIIGLFTGIVTITPRTVEVTK